MLRAVPEGKSFFGCGTTTVIAPFLNLWCDPLTLTSSNPSALRRLTMSRPVRNMRNYIHTKQFDSTYPLPDRANRCSLDRGPAFRHEAIHANTLNPKWIRKRQLSSDRCMRLPDMTTAPN